MITKKKEKEIILKEINNFKKKLFQFKRKYTKEIVELNYEKKFQSIKKLQLQRRCDIIQKFAFIFIRFM